MRRMEPGDEARAKELFEAFDGSVFFMSRDGADVEFEALGVPSDLQAKWLREMTARKLATLGEPGSWRSIHFLSHHRDFMRVSEVLAASLSGTASEQLSYLREALAYLTAAKQHGKVSRVQLDAAAGSITDRALAVATRWPAAHDQVDALVRKAAAI